MDFTQFVTAEIFEKIEGFKGAPQRDPDAEIIPTATFLYTTGPPESP